MSEKVFSIFLNWLNDAIEDFPDDRRGTNSQYKMKNAVLGAYSAFHIQCPSFLEHQAYLEANSENNNTRSLFGIEDIPSHNQIRRILDAVSPDYLGPVYKNALIWLEKEQNKKFESLRYFENTFLIPLDGTSFFSSNEIYCDNCSTKKRKDGTINYSHSAITPAIVHPSKSYVIPFQQEFITPQDGDEKQDCENKAAKRWLKNHGEELCQLGVTILGDDLYSHQTICEAILEQQLHFILTCKSSSHKYLTEWIAEAENGVDIVTKTQKIWTGKEREYHTYRFMNNIPIRDGKDALKVNWCELIITDKDGKIKKQFAYITDFTITENNVTQIITSGRCRWKIENENNNTLKTKGYHIEHNFGHGKKYLSNFLLSLNILSFLCHTLLDIVDKRWQLLRSKLYKRRRFFRDMSTLIAYICFSDWDALLIFMIKRLKIPDPEE